MKKTLLLFLVGGLNFCLAQTLESENFNAMTIGNVGTDFTGATPGANGYRTLASNGVAPTTSNNAANSNFQIVANGNALTQGLQIIGPNGNKGGRIMVKQGLDAAWATRTSFNNIVELEYDFFTGPITDSRTQIGMRINGTSATDAVEKALNGFVYTTNTRELAGVCYLNNNGIPGTFLVGLAAGGLILDSNTWYTIGCSYNTVTGEMLWKTSPSAIPTSLGAAYWIPGYEPTEVRVNQAVVTANPTANPPVPANIATSTIIFDNYICRASATNTLLSTNNFNSIEKSEVSLYPNPTNNILNINSVETVKSVTIIDINGRTVLQNNINLNNPEINVAELNSGIYFVSVTTDLGTSTQKIIKN